MSAKNASNIRERITAPAEMLAPAIVELLRRIPDTWQTYRPDDLSETQSQALFLLVAAGMVERRERMRLRMLNHPLVVEATFTATGEYGGVEALTALAAQTWEDWQDAFRRWKEGPTPTAPPFHCERLEPSEWRLTDQGVIARKDVRAGKKDAAVDFVLKRGFFDGRPRMMPDGGISQRRPVRGKGALERMEKRRGEPASTVEIANWGKGAEAFSAAFAKILETGQGQRTRSLDAPAPDDGVQEPSGIWSRPMPLTEMGVRIFKDATKWRSVRSVYGDRLRRTRSRKFWQIRLDGLSEDLQDAFAKR